jgi:hypothetical protein
MVVTRGPGLQYDSPKKNHPIGAILGRKNIAQSAHLVDIPYNTALDIWKKYKNTSSMHNLPCSGHLKKVTDHTK